MKVSLFSLQIVICNVNDVTKMIDANHKSKTEVGEYQPITWQYSRLFQPPYAASSQDIGLS